MAKVYRRSKETIDELIARFSDKTYKEGIPSQLAEKEYYKTDNQKKRDKRYEKRWRQKQKRKARAKKYDNRRT